MNIKRLDSSDSNFQLELAALLAWESVSDDAVFAAVNEILRAVKSHGDSALLEYSQRRRINIAAGVILLVVGEGNQFENTRFFGNALPAQ